MYEQGILEEGIQFKETSFILRSFHVIEFDQSAVFHFFYDLVEPTYPPAVTSTLNLYVV